MSLPTNPHLEMGIIALNLNLFKKKKKSTVHVKEVYHLVSKRNIKQQWDGISAFQNSRNEKGGLLPVSTRANRGQSAKSTGRGVAATTCGGGEGTEVEEKLNCHRVPFSPFAFCTLHIHSPSQIIKLTERIKCIL